VESVILIIIIIMIIIIIIQRIIVDSVQISTLHVVPRTGDITVLSGSKDPLEILERILSW
jgi:hypothetical protein